MTMYQPVRKNEVYFMLVARRKRMMDFSRHFLPNFLDFQICFQEPKTVMNVSLALFCFQGGGYVV